MRHLKSKKMLFAELRHRSTSVFSLLSCSENWVLDIHQCSHYLNNLLEQDHRGIKQRYYPMRGFGTFTAAARFCRTFDEIRQFFRFRTTIGQLVSLPLQRDVFRQRLNAFNALVLRAS